VKIEHSPFKGAAYEQGIKDKKIAIVGYSHWHDGQAADHDGLSVFTVEKVIKGEWSPRFFGAIRNSFDFNSHKEFWNRVLFFNYVPTIIGTGAERFGTATDDEATVANARFERIVDEYRPDVVFVFTKKTQLGALQLGFKPLPEPFQGFVQATRNSQGHISQIVRLRHPQGASGTALKQAISHIIDEKQVPNSRDQEPL
jgi:hypothetical protein